MPSERRDPIYDGVLTFDAWSPSIVASCPVLGSARDFVERFRREAVAAVSAEYPDKQAALQSIADRLREHYRAYPSVDGRKVELAIAGTQDVWARNVFPAMKVTWGTYPNQIGHDPAPGCFRCHDDEHKTKEGRVIRQDCELCHTMT